MTIEASDVHQVLEFRADTAIVRLLPVGLALLFLGLFTFALFDGDRPSVETVLAMWVLVVAGIGITVFALWRRSNRGKPMFVLSPAGVHYRIAGVKTFLVPWREIRSLDTIDITSWNWSIRNPGAMTFSNVTVILVSKNSTTRAFSSTRCSCAGPPGKISSSRKAIRSRSDCTTSWSRQSRERCVTPSRHDGMRSATSRLRASRQCARG